MPEGRSNSATAEALVITERALEKHATRDPLQAELPPPWMTIDECSACWRSCAPHRP
jgi:hypothetical protein